MMNYFVLYIYTAATHRNSAQAGMPRPVPVQIFGVLRNWLVAQWGSVMQAEVARFLRLEIFGFWLII